MENEALLINEFRKFCIKYYELFLELCKNLDKAIWAEIINLNRENLLLENNWIATLNYNPNAKNLVEIFNNNSWSTLNMETMDFKTLVELYPKISAKLVLDFLEKFQLESLTVLNKIIKFNPNLKYISHTYFNGESIIGLNDYFIDLKGLGLLTTHNCSYIIYTGISLVDGKTCTGNIETRYILSTGEKLWRDEKSRKI